VLLSLPDIKNNTTDLKIFLNIAEAVLMDTFSHKDYINSTFGTSLIFMLPVLSKVNIIDNEGFKLWTILYFIWNIKFCKNLGSGDDALSHNIPALMTILLSFGYTSTEMKHNFSLLRSASIRTYYLLDLDWLLK
jgi:hypothetical protein